MRIQKAASRKIIYRRKLHGTRLSSNLACLKQWYSLILQWMKWQICWAVPSFGNIQYSVSVHDADDLESGSHWLNYFTKKCSGWVFLLGREKDFCICLYETAEDQGLVTENGRRKSGNEGGVTVTSWWEWVLVYGCCFLTSLPLFSQLRYSEDWEGEGTGKPLASLHLNLTPPEPAFLYDLWKILKFSCLSLKQHQFSLKGLIKHKAPEFEELCVLELPVAGDLPHAMKAFGQEHALRKEGSGKGGLQIQYLFFLGKLPISMMVITGLLL